MGGGRWRACVTIQTEATFGAGAQSEWFVMRRSDATGRELVLVINWFQELKARERE
jgi:hypothetical protein